MNKECLVPGYVYVMLGLRTHRSEANLQNNPLAVVVPGTSTRYSAAHVAKKTVLPCAVRPFTFYESRILRKFSRHI